MLQHCSITYAQSLRAILGLLTVGRVGNLLCGRTTYINITITILDIIHCPVFYLKLISTLQVCTYLTGNTLRLRYEPNRLMLSVGVMMVY
jgi:hypothetical protein